jgi:sigma-B regulation protein RsbU (phosphoserine phosphatase)
VIVNEPNGSPVVFGAGGLAQPTSAIWPYVLLLGLLALLAFIALKRFARDRRRIAALTAQIELLSYRRKIVFDFLHDLGEAFTEGIDLEELLRMIANFSVNTTQASAGAVFLLDSERKTLRAEVVIGPYPPPERPASLPGPGLTGRPRDLEQMVKSQTIPLGKGLIGEVAQRGKPVLIQDGLRDPRLVQYEEPSLQTRTAIFIPLKFKDEVLGVMAVVNKQAGETAPFFNANDLFLLDSLADHAAISLYNTTLYTLEAEQKRIDNDLRVASEIQKMLLPEHAPAVRNFELCGHNTAAQHVGGDYYDFLPLDDSRVGVVIADVSGKAIPGALVMTICRSAIRAQARLSQSPIEVLRHVNESVIPDLRPDMFVTILYGVLDSDARTFTFARAGHDPVIWYRAKTGTLEVITPHGMAVGLDRSGRFDRELEERRINLSPGDVLTLYTDGITESLDQEDREFGRAQLMEVVKDHAGESACKISESIFESLRQFTNESPALDDRTLIIIKAA